MPDTPTPDERAAMREDAKAARRECRSYEPDVCGPCWRHQMVTRLLDALDAAEAEVARLAARPAPVRDEEAVREAVRRAVAGVVANVSNWPDGAQVALLGRDLSAPIDAITAAALAVVREHLPVKPDRKVVERALLSASGDWDMSPLDRSRMVTAQTHAVLDLWPGRPEAEVKAEALREFADAHRFPSHWIMFRRDDGTGVTVSDMLREVADRLAAEGGADRG